MLIWTGGHQWERYSGGRIYKLFFNTNVTSIIHSCLLVIKLTILIDLWVITDKIACPLYFLACQVQLYPDFSGPILFLQFPKAICIWALHCPLFSPWFFVLSSWFLIYRHSLCNQIYYETLYFFSCLKLVPLPLHS